MTDNYQTSTRNFIRGGQVLLHNYRMLKQLFDRVLVFTAAVFFLVTIGVTYLRLNQWHIFALKYWSSAHALHFFNNNATLNVVYPGAGKPETVIATRIINSPWVIGTVKQTGPILVLSMFCGIVSSFAFFSLIYILLVRRGKKQSETKKLRGYEIGTIRQIRKLVKKLDISDISLATVPMPKNFETGHILIHGTTGMGKSVCIKELLDQIRIRGDKAIIYDQGGDYISSFYQNNDVILNPLDDRTASWNLWKECRDSADYDSLAAALIPTTAEHSDPFWTNGARIIFSAMARELKHVNKPTMTSLLDSLLTTNLATIESVLCNTEAAPLLSHGIEKTALSFKATLASYLKCLKYIKDEENPFSIRSWIQDDSKKNWLFISSTADRHETLKPLISMWLDLSANALLSLSPSYSRRIWLIFDELASLHKLPYLPNAFAQSRKYGGCIVAGMQSIAQLRKIYGQHAADEISTMCNTRVFFRSPSNEAAVWTSKELGQHEIEEMREGISYSESAMRSGISIDKQIAKKDLVSAPEIMQLQVLEAYMRLPGELPIIKINFKYKSRNGDTPGYIAREIIELNPINETSVNKKMPTQAGQVSRESTKEDNNIAESIEKNGELQFSDLQNKVLTTQSEKFNKEKNKEEIEPPNI